MARIRVLALASDHFGVGHFRTINPHRQLENFYPDEFECDIRIPGYTHGANDDDIDKFDIVNFHRRINDPKKTHEWIEKFRKTGTKIVMDIDDYWLPFDGHPARSVVIETKAHHEIIGMIRAADHVTTTTSIFADVIRSQNKNVVVLPNILDLNQRMWEGGSIEAPDGRVRVGWIGGSSHHRDLKLLCDCFRRMFGEKELRDKIQVVMCGYDIRGSMTIVHPFDRVCHTCKEAFSVNPGDEKKKDVTDACPNCGSSDTGKKKRTRDIEGEESVWNDFEGIFNGRGTAEEGVQYVRRRTLPITKYGEHYNHIDVALAPLDPVPTFNQVKSELKVLEAGQMGKAIIASDVAIYKEVLTHDETALLVSARKNHKDWYKMIRRIVLDDELRNRLATNLQKMVAEKYNEQVVSTKRREFYRSLLGR